MNILEIQHLTKSFGKFKAVDDLSMTIAPGEIVAFIGQNGAGKSTTMRCIAGLSAIDCGKILVCGSELEKDPLETRRHFGYVPQDLALYHYMTGEEFLSLIGNLRGLSPKALEAQIEELLTLCDLKQARHRLIREYSGGMARKIAMACALIGAPELVILDESFVGLDPESTYKLGHFLKTVAQEGRSILISSHILEMLYGLCTRFFFLHHGRCVADYTKSELDAQLQDPKTSNLTALYLLKTGQAALMNAHEATL